MTAPSVFTMSAFSSSMPMLQRSIPTARRRAAPLINLATRCSDIRHKSTTRRMTKALRLHPHASFVGTASTIPAKSSHPPPSLSKAEPISSLLPNIIHNPPAAAPTPHLTPKLFIPQDDPRYSAPSPTAILTTAPALAVEPIAPRPQLTGSDGETSPDKLPPALTRPYQKTYHLSETDIQKIQRLRKSNPDKYSRNALAKMFGCSEFFIGMVAPTTDERKAKMLKKTEEVKEKWGKIRTFAREERSRRRVLWSKDL
ncbi:hypothetical protein ABW20_dc0110358 [Dactylellina cionopaga]|nr:hypothetical protein ABW20_dc0110358 [Dactylellina cionopaga]